MWFDLQALIWFCLLGCLALFWWQNLKMREIALKAVKHYCDREGLQLLDQSVALKGMGFQRDPHTGQLVLRRRYRFEFTSTGDERYQGTVVLHGQRLAGITTEPYRIPE
ncbi:MAG: DUF3301 domain-containing protein [Nitrincola lacisaponensis]|uniref:DUF3301 domain-containing protein n=1 Tax=Nitrincola lacisaponensis TaxID=267850 RepID=UPI003919CC13